jgi:Chemotaxis signal transduction protein
MTDDELQFVIFQVGSQALALSIFQVERILRWEQPATLPNAPAFLEGVLPYGDGVVAVVDLRKRLDVPATQQEETRVMVLELEDQRVGIVVDAVSRGRQGRCPDHHPAASHGARPGRQVHHRYPQPA